MADPDKAVVCGWYGKLPAVGDFATRRLTPAMVARCDAWLSAGLAASQRELGDGWLDLYLTAPIWRFAWGPGLAGDDAWLGVLMPSVDRVGRYFPLLLAAPCPAGWLTGNGDTLGHAAEDWLDRLADTAQDCLRPGASLSSLEEALAADPLRVRAEAETCARPAESLRHSLWWLHQGTRQRCPGLPERSAFTALLHGDD